MLAILFKKFLDAFAAGLAVVIYIFFVYDDERVRNQRD